MPDRLPEPPAASSAQAGHAAMLAQLRRPGACGGHASEVGLIETHISSLLLAGEQLDTGLPAAMVALLHQWQVPLVGLVQGDGGWDPEARRSDGLPWLGGLDPATGETSALAAALAATG